MTASVKWADSARDDLDDIVRYIERDSPRYADLVHERLLKATRHLATFPLMGREVPQDDSHRTRELIVEGYHVMYEVDGDTIWIMRVVHDRRDLDDPANQPWGSH